MTNLVVLPGDYRQEGVAMPYTIADFEPEYLVEHIEALPPAKRVKGLTLRMQ